jgi:class 3 adenylate cyclase/tetratricopeptide (TPR) repeat protein
MGSRYCAECGHRASETARFCEQCGSALTAGARPLRAPDTLASKILSGRAGIEGERKQVTVMFTDIVGSMELTRSLDTERWGVVLDRFLAIAARAVHGLEGTVNQFTGDGLMAVFGAPVAHEDHARRACLAVLQLQRDAAALSEELMRTDGVEFAVRCGLNSGEVIVGSIGDDLHMDFAPLGNTTALGKRMESLAPIGSTAVSASTAALVEGEFELRELGEFEVKGSDVPQRVLELVGPGMAHTRLEAVAATRGLSRFVGREAERVALNAALEHALAGDGRAVGIVGEPGVGKSRLCFEFAQRCRKRGIDVWEAHALAHAKGVPFMPVLEILRSYFAIADSDVDATVRAKIGANLLALDSGFQDDLPLVFEFLGAGDPDQPPPRMEPEARQRRLFAVIDRLVRLRSAQSPMVILVEDLHWLDPGSEGFLENLIAVLPASHTLVLATLRPEYHATWMRTPCYQHVKLGALSGPATRELLSHLMGDDPSLDGLADLIARRTDGNPFFIEEVVRSLTADGSLIGDKGAYRLAHPVDQVAIPATVQAVLAARIDRLNERDKAVLETAAVIGRRFAEPVLSKVADVSADEFASALHELVDEEFFIQESRYPEAEYAFTHPLTEEVAYRTQLTERRARLHGAVALSLTQLYPERHDEHAALLSHHWERAGELVNAAECSARAATWAGFNDPSEALRHWRRVGDLLAGGPQSPATQELAVASRAQVLNFAWRLGDGVSDEDTALAFDQGRLLAERLGDHRSLVLLTAMYAMARGMVGPLNESVPLAREAARLAEEIGDEALQVTVTPILHYQLLLAGELREALAVVNRVIALCSRNPTLGAGIVLASPYAVAMWHRGWLRLLLGDLAGGKADAERGLELARAHGDIETEGWIALGQGFWTRFTGSSRDAHEHTQHGVDIAERLGGSFSRCWAHTGLGFSQLARGEWEQAISALERAVEITRHNTVGADGDAWRRGYLAEAYAGAGEAERAEQTAREAVRLGSERGQRYWEADAQLSLARVLLHTRGVDAAGEIDAALQRSLTLSRQIGALSIQPLIHVEQARLARLRDDDAAAERALCGARKLFAAIGLPARAASLSTTSPLPSV